MQNNTQSSIILTTIKYIEQNGYQKLSLRKISHEVGMTTGAFYKHFKNKDELFYQTSLALSKQVTTKLHVDANKSIIDQLLEMAQQFCQLFEEEPRIMDFLFFNPSLEKIYQEEKSAFSFLRLAKKLTHEVNPGILTDDQFFIQIWSFIQGYSLLIKNKVAIYNPDLVSATLQQFMKGKN